MMFINIILAPDQPDFFLNDLTFAGFFGGLENYFQTLNEENAGNKRFWCI